MDKTDWEALTKWSEKLTEELNEAARNLIEECSKVINDHSALLIGWEVSHRDRLLAERMMRERVKSTYCIHRYGDWEDDPTGVVRQCERCGELEVRPEG